jgi:hypothetical protein
VTGGSLACASVSRAWIEAVIIPICLRSKLLRMKRYSPPVAF